MNKETKETKPEIVKEEKIKQLKLQKLDALEKMFQAESLHKRYTQQANQIQAQIDKL